MDAWKLEDRYVYLHVAKMRLEAGNRSVPGGLSRGADAPSGGGVQWRRQFAVRRLWRARGQHLHSGRAGPHLYGKHTEQDILDQFTLGDSGALGIRSPLSAGGSARQVMADMFRGMFEKATNSDIERSLGFRTPRLLLLYDLPNFFVFPGISLPMIYRFRPDPRDHTRCSVRGLVHAACWSTASDRSRPSPSSARRSIVQGSRRHGLRFRRHSGSGHWTTCFCSRKDSRRARNTA